MGFWTDLLSDSDWPPDVTMSGGDGWIIRSVWRREQFPDNMVGGIVCWFSAAGSEFNVCPTYSEKRVFVHGSGGVNGAAVASRRDIRNRVRWAAEIVLRDHLPNIKTAAAKSRAPNSG